MSARSLKDPLLLGAHLSIAGGLHLAIERAEQLKCTALQIFTKNSNQWKVKPLTEESISAFRQAVKQSSIQALLAHDAYLINLACPKEEIHRKSLEAFLVEMQRAESLGLHCLVTHPGAHLGRGEDFGIRRVADSLNLVLNKTEGFSVKILLETTAGQGTSLGRSFQELAAIMEKVDQPERVGICFDTCHVFTAGYDIRSREGYEKVMKEFDHYLGLENLLAFHLNDSKKDLGSRVDRHEHIGKGTLGREPFRAILTSKCFRKVPKILETPKGPDTREDRMNLRVLRQLADSGSSRRRTAKRKKPGKKSS